MNDHLFRIKNSNGLYSNGGYNPSFTKRGKVWTTASLLSHLALVNRERYKDCVLEVHETTPVKEIQINDYVHLKEFGKSLKLVIEE